MLLDLLQPHNPVLGLHVDMRLLKMVPNDSHTPKHWFCHQKHVLSMLKSLVYPQVRMSLLEVLLDLLQPMHTVLGLQIDLRLLKIVSNDSPYPKTFSLIPKLFL